MKKNKPTKQQSNKLKKIVEKRIRLEEAQRNKVEKEKRG